MIITKKKPFQEILNYLKGKEKIFLFGCNSCAEQCRTGGPAELEEMKEGLSKQGKEITGVSLVEETCYKMRIKKEFRLCKEIAESDAILVLACGAGVTTVAEVARQGVPVLPALDSLFLASVERYGRFFEGCSLCGDCILAFTGGICPHSTCPKGILNGPCGGVDEGKCEVCPENRCAWVEIYNKLKAQGRLDLLKHVYAPKNHANSLKPRKVILDRRKIKK